MVDKETIIVIASDHGFCADSSKSSKSFKRIRFEPLLKKLNIDKMAKGVNIGTRALIRIVNEKDEDTIIDLLTNTIVKETGQKLFEVRRIGYNNVSLIINTQLDEVDLNEDYHMFCNSIECKLREVIIKMPDTLSGTHHVDGILIMSGPNIKKGVFVPRVKNTDIVPTLLVLLNLPVGKDMDGKVINEIIEEEYLKKFPIKYIDSYDGDYNYHPKSDLEKEEEIETLEKQLKSLGYL